MTKNTLIYQLESWHLEAVLLLLKIAFKCRFNLKYRTYRIYWHTMGHHGSSASLLEHQLAHILLAQLGAKLGDVVAGGDVNAWML